MMSIKSGKVIKSRYEVQLCVTNAVGYNLKVDPSPGQYIIVFSYMHKYSTKPPRPQPLLKHTQTQENTIFILNQIF
jgi:hypothetical protein